MIDGLINNNILLEFRLCSKTTQCNCIFMPPVFDWWFLTEQELIDPLLRENPRGVGLQTNGRYASFYRRNWGFLKIILEIKDSKLEIITFMNTEAMPNLKRLDNEK